MTLSMGIHRGRGFPARFTYRNFLWAHLRGHRNNWHGVCSQMHWHTLWITRMTVLSMGISHWQYVWSFYSCVYLVDICLVEIFTGHCHFWHIFRALYFLTFFASIVLEHSPPALSNVACLSDMYNLAIFPGHIFFGHISRAFIFLGMFYDKTTRACYMDINCVSMFSGKFRPWHNSWSHIIGGGGLE